MKFYWMYFVLQLKKGFHDLPKLLGGIIVLAVLVSAIAFSGTKLLYSSNASKPAVIALVIEDDSPIMNLGLTYLNSSESINSFCTLEIVSKNRAQDMLRSGNAAAIVYFPENFSEDVMSGKNTPARVTFSKNCGIEQLLFQELASAAAKILGYAQADIFALSDLRDTFRFKKSSHRMYDELNEQTLQKAMMRSNLFQIEEISAIPQQSTQDYYILSCMTILFFLSGMTLGSFAQKEPPVLAALLARRGLTATGQLLSKTLVLWILYTILFGLVLLVSIPIGYLPLTAFLLLPVISLLVASFTLAVYAICTTYQNGTMLVFFLTLISSICSGCLIPRSFLPSAIAKAGGYLPTAYIQQALSHIKAGGLSELNLFPMLLYSTAFILLALLCQKYSKEVD